MTINLVPEKLLHNREATEQVARWLYMAYMGTVKAQRTTQCEDAAVLLDWLMENLDVSHGCPSLASTTGHCSQMPAILHQWVIWEACNDLWPVVDNDPRVYGASVLVWTQMWCRNQMSLYPKVADTLAHMERQHTNPTELASRFKCFSDALFLKTESPIQEAVACAGQYLGDSATYHMAPDQPLDPRRAAHQRARMYLLLAGWDNKEKTWGTNHLPPITQRPRTWPERNGVQNPVVGS